MRATTAFLAATAALGAALLIAGPTPYANYVGDALSFGPAQRGTAVVAQDGNFEHLAPRGHLDPGRV
uniref:Uncharacterized protein n=1 Tax=Streptomyces sp. NBC_00049 TaxID=2903617 RepID=A0AAU2JYZ4_9ACTN